MPPQTILPSVNGSAAPIPPLAAVETRMSHLPYPSHPLFLLRKTLIIINTLGLFVFYCSSDSSWYWPDGLTFSFIALDLSASFCVWDVHKYAKKEAELPDGEHPKWPNRLILLVDLALAVGAQFVFWVAVSTVRFGGYGDALGDLASAWGCLADLLVSLLHAYCFWKQLMACYKTKWLSTIPHGPCPRCGYHEAEADIIHGRSATCPVAQSQPAEAPATPTVSPNLCTYVGPPADHSRDDAFTPSSEESAMEEGLLIGSEYGGYGSTDQHVEPVLEQPEDVMVGKGRKKRASAPHAGPSERALGKRPVLN